MIINGNHSINYYIKHISANTTFVLSNWPINLKLFYVSNSKVLKGFY